MGFSFQFLNSISDIPAQAWDSLWHTDYPFTQHTFLATLENSQSVGGKSGWQPRHLTCYKGDTLVLAMPLFLKTHSYGEYVFDWSWADAYHQNGLEYYPKLVNAIPFTPATGPRVAIGNLSSEADKHALLNQLGTALEQFCVEHGISGFHALFPDVSSTQTFKSWPALLPRLGCQFHWFNASYDSFEHFLEHIKSRKRKAITRERRKVQEAGIQVRMDKGTTLKPEDWQHFYTLYQRTYLKRSGHTGYLSEDFFVQLGKSLPDQTAMARAFQDEKCVAAALYFFDDNTLYGRYWGALDELDGLHFECCYYQGIEFAIQEKLTRFDPGAQGEHKIQRGFTPVLTHSLHWLAKAEFHHAIDRFVQQEAKQIQTYCADTRSYLPFKEDTPLVQTSQLLEHHAK